jgi:transposase
VAVDPRDARIAELERKLEAQAVLIEALLCRIDEIGRENAELRARLNESSRNSSKPPSSDGPQVTRPRSGPTGRRRGGQPGQTGARRPRLSPDNVVDYKPKVCRGCTRELSGEDADLKWFQVFELPEVKPTVTEHRAHSLTCAQCGTVTSESLPSDVLAHGFGPRIEALVAYLSGRCGLSKR